MKNGNEDNSQKMPNVNKNIFEASFNVSHIHSCVQKFLLYEIVHHVVLVEPCDYFVSDFLVWEPTAGIVVFSEVPVVHIVFEGVNDCEGVLIQNRLHGTLRCYTMLMEICEGSHPVPNWRGVRFVFTSNLLIKRCNGEANTHKRTVLHD